MGYLFVYYNYQLIASIIFIVSCIIILRNFKKTTDIENLFIIFLIPSTMYMLMFRQWADSHSYWSYYFLVCVSLSLLIVAGQIKTKRMIFFLLMLICFSAIINIYNTSSYLYKQRVNPLSKETLDFIEKYKNFYYVTADDTIGYGFGFRNRWLENKKFNNINSFDFKNKKNILLISRINNCQLDKGFKIIEFFNWCYKKYN